MKRFQIFLPSEMIEELRRMANGRPVAELVRQAIAEYIQRQKRRG